jgi:hypothetical protein
LNASVGAVSGKTVTSNGQNSLIFTALSKEITKKKKSPSSSSHVRNMVRPGSSSVWSRLHNKCPPGQGFTTSIRHDNHPSEASQQSDLSDSSGFSDQADFPSVWQRLQDHRDYSSNGSTSSTARHRINEQRRHRSRTSRHSRKANISRRRDHCRTDAASWTTTLHKDTQPRVRQEAVFTA